jgi:cardiolipin synthase A/B
MAEYRTIVGDQPGSDKSKFDEGNQGTRCAEAGPGRIVRMKDMHSRNERYGGAWPRRAADDRTDWELFHSNREVWAAVLEMCASARDSIAAEQYIFHRTGIGRELLDLLASRARHGVRVRIVADAFGSRFLRPSEGAAALLKAGGEILYFNGVRGALRRPGGMLTRLHRKTIICDGRRFMTGGSCFHPRMRDWRDSMVRVEGPVVREALREFEDSWRYAAGNQTTRRPKQLPPLRPSDWSYMVTAPYRPKRRDYYQALRERIESADRTITIATPYVVPGGDPFWGTLQRAVNRGVRVRLIVPSKSDQPLIDMVSLSFVRRLARQGIEVYGYEPGMMHAKLSVIDDDWAAVGSFNLGVDSFSMNSECSVVSRLPAFHAALLGQLEIDLSLSRRL